MRLCVIACLLLVYINQIDAKQNDAQNVEPLIEYIRQRRHQVYDVEPNEYVDQKENYPKIVVTQHKKKGTKHKKQKNVKHEKLKDDNAKKIRNRNRKQKSDPDSDKKIEHKASKSRKTQKKDNNEWVQENYKESNLSESADKHGSPVDIIVHIKMNE